jgi:hypothetical protein
MPKTMSERIAKRCNRKGVLVEIDLREVIDVAPTYRKVRWGWAVSELEGRCFSYAPWGGGWPLTMGFRKHLYTSRGECRRCGAGRPVRVDWNPNNPIFTVGGRRGQ